MAASIQHAGLNTLPEEILETICSRLTGNELAQISYVNKRLQRHAFPFLYRDINLKWTESRTPGIVPLLLTVLTSNELAAHTQHLSLFGEVCAVTSSFRKKNLLKLDEHLLVSKFIQIGCKQLIAKNPQYQWNLGPEEYTADFFVAVLLLRLKNLETLEISANFLNGDCLRDAFKDAFLPPYPGGLRTNDYRQLHRVTLTTYMWKTESENLSEYRRISHLSGVLLENVLPLFYLPAIKTIELQRIKWTYAEWPVEPPCASSLRHLSIKDSEIKGRGLEMILKAAPQLQSLKLDFEGGEMKRGQNENNLPWEDIARAIGFVKESIEHLTIGMSFFFRQASDVGTIEDGPIKFITFEDYPRLARLEVLYDNSQEQYLLLDSCLGNVLPQTLTHLIFRDDRHALNYAEPLDGEVKLHNLLYVLSGYLESWRTSTPNLQMITFAVNDRGVAYQRTKCQETFDQLRSVCNDAGVACVLDPEVMANGI